MSVAGWQQLMNSSPMLQEKKLGNGQQKMNVSCRQRSFRRKNVSTHGGRRTSYLYSTLYAGDSRTLKRCVHVDSYNDVGI